MITTGYAMNRDEGVLLDIIKAMAKAGSSGIALKIKIFRRNHPEDKRSGK